MWEVEVQSIAEAVMLLFLGAGALVDRKEKCVPCAYLAAVTTGCVLFQLMCGQGEWILCGAGAVCGGLFLLLSVYSGEGVGYGDSWMILNLGIFLGIWKLLAVLVLAFGEVSLAAVCGVIRGKYTRKSRIPFFPFLLTGYVGVLLW